MKMLKQAAVLDSAWKPMNGLWFRNMPARTLDEMVTGRTELLMVAGGVDGYRYSSRDGFAGSGFATADEAMRDADQRLTNELTSFADRQVAAAGLDASIWAFRNMDAFVWFEKLSDPATRIERYGQDRWVIYARDASIGIASTPAQGDTILKVNAS